MYFDPYHDFDIIRNTLSLVYYFSQKWVVRIRKLIRKISDFNISSLVI